jgi:hypothetical protein
MYQTSQQKSPHRLVLVEVWHIVHEFGGRALPDRFELFFLDADFGARQGRLQQTLAQNAHQGILFHGR